MNRYIYILIMWLCSLSAIAQTEGYNPNNPPLPDFPTDDPTDTTYVLVVNSSPYGSGSLNTSGGNYKEGASVYLRAYNNGDMYFMYWIDDEGNTLTTSISFNYTMPKRDAVVTAVYRYSPSNPALPDFPEDTNIPTYNLTLNTKPAGAGSFNTSNTNLKEGESIHLYAYSNSNFYFKRWEDAQGNTISTAQNFYYTMPAVDTQLFAIYTYNPSNPSNPGKNYYDSFTGEVIIDDFTKGNLSSAIYDVTKGNTSNITSITVAGVINSNDFSIANNYSSCSIVDLSRTNGVNTVPSYCYDGNTHLNRLSLPACITNIEYRAFRNATALTELTCHATVPPTLGSNVFSGVNKGLVVYVPASSIQLYEQAAGWKEYETDGTIVIMPIQSQVSALEVNLPAECADGRYKNMPLELLNVKSGQKFKYVITDRINYTFNNLVKGTRYVATLKNLSGQVLAKTDTISIDNENVSVTFDLAGMKQIRSVKASVLTNDGTDVTDNTTITWYDSNGTFLTQSKTLDGQVSETKVKCAVSLPQTLAMEYVLPTDLEYDVVEGENSVVITLVPLPKMQISGRILDVTTQQAVSNANVTVSQTLNGKYSKSFSGKTDNKGAYTMTVFAAPSSVTYAANDYVSQTIELADSVINKEASTLADVKLKPITGATITTNFTYATSVAAGIDPEIQNYYSDYNNVAYSIYNVTAQKEIRQFNVQYPNIVLLEEVNQGDSLQIIAKSKVGSFVDITMGGRINDALRMDVTIPVVQLGGIDATFTTTENSKVLGILYDSKGAFFSKYNYGSSTLSIRELKDGDYTLVTMGASDFFGSIYNLEKFSEAGLQQNIDYLVNKVTVKSGIISPLKNVLVPFFDESKFYYTGDNTSFTVNKTSIVAGNYLTLTAKVDFKDVYKNSISDVKISVELPEGTSMVDNSVMVGSSVAYYELNGNTLTIPLDNNVSSDRVRFCVIPTKSGSFAPNASVQFAMNEKKIEQPIGSAMYNVKDVSVKVPSTTSKSEFAISGTATGRAQIYIYDGNTLLGETKALANGFWGTNVELLEPYNQSRHNIYAKIISTQGTEVLTETKELVYDENAIEVSKVKMYHFNPEVNGWKGLTYELVFDFQNPNNKPGSYVYYIYNKQFTFTIDFTENNPTKISDVVLCVKTGDGTWTLLNAIFDEKKSCWVANGDFGDMYDGNIPVNVGVEFVLNRDIRIDSKYIEDYANDKDNYANVYKEESNQALSFIESIKNELSKSEIDYDKVNSELDEFCQSLNLSIPSMSVDLSSIDNEDEWDSYFNSKYGDLIESENPIELDELLGNLTENVFSIIFEGAEYKYEVLSCENLILEDLLSSGFEKFEMSNDNFLFIKSNELGLQIVDPTSDKFYNFEYKENGSLARSKNSTSSNTNGLRAQVERFTSGITKIMSLVGNLKDDLDARILRQQEIVENAIFAKLEVQTKIDGVPWWDAGDLENLIKEHKRLGDLADKELAALENIRRFEFVKGLLQKIGNGLSALGAVYDGYKMIQDINNWESLIAGIKSPCAKADNATSNLKSEARGYADRVYSGYLVTLTADAVGIALMVPSVSSAIITAGGSLPIVLTNIATIAASLAADHFLVSQSSQWRSQIENKIPTLKDYCSDEPCKKCGNKPCTCEKRVCKKCGENPCHCKDRDDSGNEDGKNEIDPSGYVYEAVFSNRLQGVTATAYYKEMVEDMYGDLHENIVLWDAEEYAQENPLFTDENGFYRWDVPEGLWQVKYEKEGYVPTQSEWLPVPPPQMDVNIAMVQNAQPEVVSARAYEDGVEIEFSKYMNIESLNSENVYLKVINGEEESLITDAEIQMLNKEVTIEGSTTEYASKMKLATDQLGYYDEAYIIISTGVNSYAGIPMAQTFEQKLDVEKKVRELLVDAEFNVEYDGQKEVTIAAIPADAAVGKKLSVVSASDMIATTDVQEVTFDADGQATFTVNGELYGATAINYSLVDADLKATSLVNVVDPKKLEAVKAPMASRISGTSVYRGQTVALSCESEGATIYYTVDGSCPCDETKRIKYERPISINEAMTLKVMAVGANFDESDVKEYTYGIRQSDIKLNLTEGWNWSSHDVASPISVDELSGVASRVLTKTGEVIDDPVFGLVGNLTTIDGAETMKVKATKTTLLSFVGEQYNPSLTPIVLNKGWNWLGYPINQTMTINDALTYLDVEEGDVITNLDGGFATYSDDAWVGTLQTLIPGSGYLYKAASSKSFIYNTTPTVSAAKALYGHRLELKSAPWTVDKHRYPNLMPVIAQIRYCDEVVSDSTWFVGAFAGDECRGVGTYEDNMLMLSVYGDPSANITFRAVNVESGRTYDFVETLPFGADIVGSVNEPFVFRIGESSGITSAMSENSVNGIFNLQGMRVRDAHSPGLYIINTTDANGKSVIRKKYVK